MYYSFFNYFLFFKINSKINQPFLSILKSYLNITYINKTYNEANQYFIICPHKI